MAKMEGGRAIFRRRKFCRFSDFIFWRIRGGPIREKNRDPSPFCCPGKGNDKTKTEADPYGMTNQKGRMTTRPFGKNARQDGNFVRKELLDL